MQRNPILCVHTKRTFFILLFNSKCCSFSHRARLLVAQIGPAKSAGNANQIIMYYIDGAPHAGGLGLSWVRTQSHGANAWAAMQENQQPQSDTIQRQYGIVLCGSVINHRSEEKHNPPHSTAP